MCRKEKGGGKKNLNNNCLEKKNHSQGKTTEKEHTTAPIVTYLLSAQNTHIHGVTNEFSSGVMERDSPAFGSAGAFGTFEQTDISACATSLESSLAASALGDGDGLVSKEFMQV